MPSLEVASNLNPYTKNTAWSLNDDHSHINNNKRDPCSFPLTSCRPRFAMNGQLSTATTSVNPSAMSRLAARCVNTAIASGEASAPSADHDREQRRDIIETSTNGTCIGQPQLTTIPIANLYPTQLSIDNRPLSGLTPQPQRHAPGIDSESGLPLHRQVLKNFLFVTTGNSGHSKQSSVQGHKSASKEKKICESKIDIKFAAENVNGLGDKSKRNAILLGMKEKGDVLFLQETHTMDKDENYYRHMSKDTYIFAHGQSNSKGVMIIISEKIEHEVLEEHRDPNGRYIIAICLLQGYTFVLVNVYAPNVERDNAVFLNELNRKIETVIKEVSYDFIVAEGDLEFY